MQKTHKKKLDSSCATTANAILVTSLMENASYAQASLKL